MRVPSYALGAGGGPREPWSSTRSVPAPCHCNRSWSPRPASRSRRRHSRLGPLRLDTEQRGRVVHQEVDARLARLLVKRVRVELSLELVAGFRPPAVEADPSALPQPHRTGPTRRHAEQSPERAPDWNCRRGAPRDVPRRESSAKLAPPVRKRGRLGPSPCSCGARPSTARLRRNTPDRSSSDGLGGRARRPHSAAHPAARPVGEVSGREHALLAPDPSMLARRNGPASAAASARATSSAESGPSCTEDIRGTSNSTVVPSATRTSSDASARRARRTFRRARPSARP